MSYSEYQSIPIYQDYNYSKNKLNSTCDLGRISKEGEKSQKQTVRLHLVSYIAVKALRWLCILFFL